MKLATSHTVQDGHSPVSINFPHFSSYRTIHVRIEVWQWMQHLNKSVILKDKTVNSTIPVSRTLTWSTGAQAATTLQACTDGCVCGYHGITDIL